MFWTREMRISASLLIFLMLSGFYCMRASAHAVLLMEEPYGFFGTVFPTGHSAIYFEQVCAETPVVLRRCRTGELGSVITRNPGIGKYDWVAIPLVPYLYAVETPSQVPAYANPQEVWRMRLRYHERHLLGLGENLIPGDLFTGGWALLVGMSYERRIYAFSFETTAEQDAAFIARMNADKNRSHFEFLYNNCSDFVRFVLNIYFPHSFRRDIFVDAGITTPKSITHKLMMFARKHPEMQVSVFEIPQIPGLRRQSGPNKCITESLATTAYAVPIALANPYVAGGLLVDYMVRGRFQVIPRNHEIVAPSDLLALTPIASAPEGSPTPVARAAAPTKPGLEEIEATGK